MEDLKVKYPEQILLYVAPGCTFHLQPLDVGFNHSWKWCTSSKCTKWMTDEVATQLKNGIEPSSVVINTKFSMIKPLFCQWIAETSREFMKVGEIGRFGVEESEIFMVWKYSNTERNLRFKKAVEDHKNGKPNSEYECRNHLNNGSLIQTFILRCTLYC